VVPVGLCGDAGAAEELHDEGQGERGLAAHGRAYDSHGVLLRDTQVTVTLPFIYR
jgi:hypothetical protein